MLRKYGSAIALVALFVFAACGGSTPPPPAETTKSEAAPAAPAAEPAGGGEAGAYEVATVADGGTISGKVTVTGNVPKPEEVEINKDNNVCGNKKTMEDIKVGAGGTLANAVVWIEGITKGKAWADNHAGTIDQKDCHYIPQVQVVATGGSVDVVNSDPILHNIHAYHGEDTLFNIAQPMKGQKTPKKVNVTGPVHMKCDVHSWMSAWVFMAADPYFAVTKDDGSFSIGEVPPGSYTVKVWHGRFGEKSMTIKVDAKGTATADFALQAS
jgi:plastocyanin